MQPHPHDHWYSLGDALAGPNSLVIDLANGHAHASAYAIANDHPQPERLAQRHPDAFADPDALGLPHCLRD